MEVRIRQDKQYRMGILPLGDGSKLAFYDMGEGFPTLVKVRPDITSPVNKYKELEFVLVTPVDIVVAD